MERRRSRRPARTSIVLRWLAAAGLVLVVFLYYRPVRTYLHTRHELAQRAAEVRALEERKLALEQRLSEATRGTALLREARRLGLVKPGERLYIVKGIAEWRKARATIRGRG